MTVPLKLDHVTLLVTSLDRSMPYYDRLLPLLGFRKEKDHVWSDGAGFFLQFLQAQAGTRAYDHLGFGAGTPERVHSIRAAMQEAGFPVPDVQHVKGATALFMRDPDGIRFEITHYPPGTPVVD
jgi:lactoylglutathione lyase